LTSVTGKQKEKGKTIMKSKLTKIIASIALAAIGSVSLPGTALATVSCWSADKAWNSSYTLNCYNQYGYLEARATGSTATMPVYPYTQSASVKLLQGNWSRTQTKDSFGVNIPGCVAVDVTVDGIAGSDNSGCNAGVTFSVQVSTP
jgi:hypothetical protein